MQLRLPIADGVGGVATAAGAYGYGDGVGQGDQLVESAQAAAALVSAPGQPDGDHGSKDGADLTSAEALTADRLMARDLSQRHRLRPGPGGDVPELFCEVSGLGVVGDLLSHPIQRMFDPRARRGCHGSRHRVKYRSAE